MESISINILCNGMNLPVMNAYQALSQTAGSITLKNTPDGFCDVCIIIDDVPANINEIKARKFLFFGSETIYPVDYYDSIAAKSFLKQFDGCYGPYPYDEQFIPFLPALPFMYDDNHGRLSLPNTEIATKQISKEKQLGVYTIISNKKITEYQYVRLKLFEYLSQKLGSYFHLFGNGFDQIVSKISTGHHFTHSIAVENRKNPFIISEKFYDPIILQNELFYLGGDYHDKSYAKFVTDISCDSFDTIYAKISNSLSTYSTSDEKDECLAKSAVMALQDNFINRIIDVVTGTPLSADYNSKTLRPIRHFKKQHFVSHPIQFYNWKYRGKFL